MGAGVVPVASLEREIPVAPWAWYFAYKTLHNQGKFTYNPYYLVLYMKIPYHENPVL